MVLGTCFCLFPFSSLSSVLRSSTKNTNEESHDLFKWLDSQKEGSAIFAWYWGGGMGDRVWDGDRAKVVAAGMLEAAVSRLMGKDEEADGRRRRARELGAKARRALEKGEKGAGERWLVV
ncbi:hypothetical protein KSP39_PZI020212 [Platanthera zijinensis]|uniref:Uncharacterized protein n=1 Tax=Platanthera zijinensis TaxID=2320716 RepID=A0AAP0AZM7_9ASPA